MEKTFNLTVATPEKVFYQGQALSLVVPCENGYLGVLANHAPLAACTKEGRITAKRPKGPALVFTCFGSGFLEVLRNNVTIIVDLIKD